VICFNHLVALGLAAGLHDCGLTIGRDLSLIGFDDVADAEAIRPRLTSVSTGPTAIGEKAALLLSERIANPDLSPRRMVNDTTLNIRQSCGPPA
jgi:LacI family transcriptional regulator